jgi:hypothetical protein
MSASATVTSGTTISSSVRNAIDADICTEITGSLPRDGQAGMTAQLKLFSGTASAPGLGFSSDTDTGLYRIGGDNIGVSIGGVKLLDMSSAALALTGTLAVSGAVTLTTVLGVASGGTGGATAAAGFDALAPTTTRGDIITRGASSNGRVALGTTGYVVQSNGTDTVFGQLVAGAFANNTVPYAALANAATAAQSDMETGSSTALIVTPGRQHFHPGHPKASAKFNSSGVVARSFNVASVTDNGTGSWSPQIATDFSDADYDIEPGVLNATGLLCQVNSQAAGSFGFSAFTLAGAASDGTALFFVAHGDHA